MIGKLVFSGIKREKTRFAVAALGVAAAVGMLAWSLGLAMTAVNQAPVQARALTGPWDCWLTTTGVGEQTGGRARPGRGFPRPLREELIAKIRSVPAVQQTCPLAVFSAPLDYRPGGKIMQGPGLRLDLALAPAEGEPFGDVVEGRWPNAESEALEVAVRECAFNYGRRLGLPPLGSQLVFMTPNGAVNATVTAYVRGGRKLMGFPTAYGSGGLVRAVAGGRAPLGPSLLLCRLRDEKEAFDVADAVADHDRRAERAGLPPSGAKVVSRADLKPRLANDSLKNFIRQLPLLLTLATLTALCMLVNSLMVGIGQKMRELALLRAAGMTVRQTIGLVALEGLVTALAGWAVGIVGGWAVVAFFAARAPETYPVGAAIGWQTPAATLALALVVTAVALIWPCARAARIRPLDVLAGRREAGARVSGKRTVLGLILMLPMLALGLPLPLTPLTRSALMLAVGIPLHAIGLFLFLPFLIAACDRVLGPILSFILGLDPRLARRRLGRNFARAAGMVMTIGVGLGTFTAIHMWGGTLMGAFIPSKEFPEIIVSALPDGFSREDAKKIPSIEGVEKHRGLEMEVAQFYLSDAMRERAEQRARRPFAPDYNVIIVGADPAALFAGEDPLANFAFVQGDRESAAKALAAGGACVITAMFQRETGLGLGDAVEFLAGGAMGRPELGGPRMMGGPGGPRGPGMRRGPGGRGPGGRPGGAPEPGKMLPPPMARPDAPAKIEKLTIAGVVDVNWHLLTSRARFRGRGGMPVGTAGPVFVSEDAARALTGNHDRTYFLWFNLTDDYRRLGELPAGQQIDANLKAAVAVSSTNNVRVHHRDEIADGTIAHGSQMIGDMARAPFWSLVVLSTGIITLLIASFQASAREIAVMRAVGMTRSQLARLLLCEALLACGGGVAVSLLSGLAIGWSFTAWTRAAMPWTGLQITPEVPWGVVAEGVGFTLLLCLLMAAPVIAWLVRKQEENQPLAMR